ncbi:MAG: hypothetical protein SGI74_04290 [Oligoflexia bacterium]|nr:hypothetical protein [Oligoflexia bacterium]
MNSNFKTTLIFSALIWLTACPQPKKSAPDGITRAGGLLNDQAGTEPPQLPAQTAPSIDTSINVPVTSDAAAKEFPTDTEVEEASADKKRTTAKQTTKPKEVLTQRQMQIKAANTASNHSKCEVLSEIETRLINDPGLHEAEKTRLVNTILVSLGGAACPQIVTDLKNNYKNDPVADLINLRSKQLNKLNAKKLVSLVREMSVADIPMQLRAEDVWSQAKDDLKVIKTDKGVSIEGTIKHGDKSVRIISQFPQNTQIPQSPKKDDVLKLLQDQNQTMSFSGLEGTTPVVMNTDPQTTITKASEILQAVEKKVSTQKTEAKQTPTSTQIKKWAFDTLKTDMAVIHECDNNGFTASTLDRIEDQQKGSELKITGLKLTEDIINEELKGKTLLEIAKSAIEPSSNQKVVDQNFWHFSAKSDDAIKFKSVLKVVDAETKTPRILIEYSAYNYDHKIWKKKTEPAIYYEIDSKYDSPRNTLKAFYFILDPTSAHWLKDRINRITSCVEKSSISTAGASRDSILSYILYKVHEPEMQILVKEK